jgi:hypothetical protein
MKKAVAAGVLLGLLFAGAGWNIRRVDRFTDAVTAQVELSREFCREENLSAADAALNAAMDRWREAEPWTHIFIRHSELDAVSDAFYDVRIQLGAGDTDAAEGAYDRLEAHLRSIDDMEQISFGAVF